MNQVTSLINRTQGDPIHLVLHKLAQKDVLKTAQLPDVLALRMVPVGYAIT